MIPMVKISENALTAVSGATHQHSKIREHTQTGSKSAPRHMAKGPTTDVPHVQFTDHYIQKSPRPLVGKAKPEAHTQLNTLFENARKPRDAAVRRGIAVYSPVSGTQRRNISSAP